MGKIVSVPRSHLIEKIAIEFACVWYEAGRSSGLTSKWKTTRAYARNNFERFVPKAVDILLDMLNNPHLNDLMKQEIFEALMERHNDPTLKTENQLPKVDMKKLMSIIESNKGAPSTQPNLSLAQKIDNAVKNNPFKKVN